MLKENLSGKHGYIFVFCVLLSIIFDSGRHGCLLSSNTLGRLAKIPSNMAKKQTEKFRDTKYKMESGNAMERQYNYQMQKAKSV